MSSIFIILTYAIFHMKIKENGTVHQDQYSPSNIETGWRQKYYFKIEFDGVLDMFIEIFKKNGNTREIHKDLFEKNIDKMKVDREHKV